MQKHPSQMSEDERIFLKRYLSQYYRAKERQKILREGAALKPMRARYFSACGSWVNVRLLRFWRSRPITRVSPMP